MYLFQNILVICGILISFILAAGCSNNISLLDRYKAQRHYEYGLSHLYLENTESAYDEFNAARELNPDEPKVYEGLGLVLLKEHNYKKAITKFKKAIKLDPGLAKAYLYISEAYLKLEKPKKVINISRKALLLPNLGDPQQIYYNLGLAFFALKKYGKAQEKFNQALKISPKWAQAHLWLGKSLFAQGEVSTAIVEYRKSLSYIKADWYKKDKQLTGFLHYQLGQAYVQKGYIKKAVTEFKESMSVYPSQIAEQAIEEYAGY